MNSFVCAWAQERQGLDLDGAIEDSVARSLSLDEAFALTLKGFLVHDEDRTMSAEATFHDGGCTCRFVRYRMTTKPLVVHCCHCRWCQRETGASFALNAMIESDRVQLLDGDVEIIDTPSNSGKGQKISRCPKCRIALWSNYAGAGDAVRFVRVGTLDEPDRFPPDIHIFTASKQPWVVLPPDTPAVAEYYKASEVWSKESLDRRAALLARSRQP